MEGNENITGIDEQLLQQFFADNAVELEDNGFSQEVMRQLPTRSWQLNRIWTAVCVVAGLVMVYVSAADYRLDRVQAIVQHTVGEWLTAGMNALLTLMKTDPQTLIPEITPRSLLTVFATIMALTTMMLHRAIKEERYQGGWFLIPLIIPVVVA